MAISVYDRGTYFLYNDKTGNFPEYSNIATFARSIRAPDFDNDGDNDLVLTDSYGMVHILANNGTGGMQIVSSFDLGFAWSSCETDFDNDGDLDIAAIGNELNLISNNGDGTFDESTLNFPSVGTSICSADFNMDGIDDLAISYAGGWSEYDGTVSILINEGDGTYNTPVVYNGGIDPYTIKVPSMQSAMTVI